MLTPEVLLENVSYSNRFDKKESRAKKLLEQWEEIDTKLHAMLDRGWNSKTHTARCAFGLLVMMQTGIRVGNESSAEGYVSINKHGQYFNQLVKTFGLTTLQIQHSALRGRKLLLDFVGKKQVEQSFEITDSSLIRFYKELIRGKNKEDILLGITHYELTKFVKRYVGKKFTIKDFRTARVNQLCMQTMMNTRTDHITKKSEINKTVSYIIENTATKIGHTKAICKRAYVSKHLLEFYKDNLEEQLQVYKEAKNESRKKSGSKVKSKSSKGSK